MMFRPLPTSVLARKDHDSTIEETTYAKKHIAPVGVRALVSLGKTAVRTAAKNRLIETARLMPTSDKG